MTMSGTTFIGSLIYKSEDKKRIIYLVALTKPCAPTLECIGIDSMATLEDIKGKVMLNDGNVHVITLDPKAPLIERQGQSGPYWILSVEEDGRARELSVGNPLAQAIQDLELDGPAKLNIQRTGTGFGTKYDVSVVK